MSAEQRNHPYYRGRIFVSFIPSSEHHQCEPHSAQPPHSGGYPRHAGDSGAADGRCCDPCVRRDSVFLPNSDLFVAIISRKSCPRSKRSVLSGISSHHLVPVQQADTTSRAVYTPAAELHSASALESGGSKSALDNQNGSLVVQVQTVDASM